MIVIIFISGCTSPSSEPKCQVCQSPGTWSACSEDALKTRTNYRCGAETNYSCERYAEEKTCETQINLKGKKGILDVAISPTLDETVKGMIKVEAVSVPERTTKVAFFLMPQGVELRANMPQEQLAKIERGEDNSGTDGWRYYIDTTKFNNGIYTIFIGPTYEGAPDENPWLDDTKTQVVVKN